MIKNNKVVDAMGNVLKVGDKVMYYGYSRKPVISTVNKIGEKRARISSMTQETGRSIVKNMREYWNNLREGTYQNSILETRRKYWNNLNANTYHLNRGSWVTSARIIKVTK